IRTSIDGELLSGDELYGEIADSIFQLLSVESSFSSYCVLCSVSRILWIIKSDIGSNIVRLLCALRKAYDFVISASFDLLPAG
ncbi:MAG: hypothetical protein CME61_09855, partial [Halobacteriovoraceae bacterium]|nr:hypothetical protein [Halobacteriovoraceae bacterium]